MRAAMKRATTRLVSSREAGIGGLTRPIASAITRARIRAHTIARLDYYLASVRRQPCAPAAATCTGPRRRSEAVSIVADIAQAARRKDGREIEVDGQRGDRAERRARQRRRRRARDGPWRVRRPDRWRPSVAHRRADHSQEPPRHGEALPGEAAGDRRGRRRRAADDRVRAAPSARRFSQGRHGHLGRQLRRRRDRKPLHLHERRQRTPDDDAAARARRAHGHRADRADAGGPRHHAAGARPKRYRSEADGLLEHHHRARASRERTARIATSRTGPIICTSSSSTTDAAACSGPISRRCCTASAAAPA